ncbi:MAG: hypothetical protein ACI9X4_001319 [Glaciecola sp.]|jgi:hypothetical protein
MMLQYATTFVFALLISPGAQAWGLETLGHTGIEQSSSASSRTAARAKTTSRTKVPARAVTKVRSSPQRVVSFIGQSAQSVSGEPIAIMEASIQLRVPSLLEQARTLTPGEILARFDTDLDGKLNPKEASVARRETAIRKGLKAGLLKRFDDNDNARLDAAEMSRARAEFAANRRKKMLGKYDSNRNGLLDPAERKCLQTDRQRAETRLNLQRRFDLNHDNLLDSSEAAALKSFTSGNRVIVRDASVQGAEGQAAGQSAPTQNQRPNQTQGKPNGEPSTVKPTGQRDAKAPNQKSKVKVQRKAPKKGTTRGIDQPKSGS